MGTSSCLEPHSSSDPAGRQGPSSFQKEPHHRSFATSHPTCPVSPPAGGGCPAGAIPRPPHSKARARVWAPSGRWAEPCATPRACLEGYCSHAARSSTPAPGCTLADKHKDGGLGGRARGRSRFLHDCEEKRHLRQDPSPSTGKRDGNKPGLLVPRSSGRLREQLGLHRAEELAPGSRSFPPRGPGPLPRTDSPTRGLTGALQVWSCHRAGIRVLGSSLYG